MTTSALLPTIKHLVISGGGAAGFSYYGILKQTQIKGLWNTENIKSIYATSAGTMIAVIIALGYDWNTIDDYVIKRPWHKVFKFELSMAFKSILNQGIFDINVLQEIFKPLFKGKDIPIDISLLDFYERTNKEIHFFTTDFHTFNEVDISYKTHPEWKVIDAIYASSALPVVFIPLYVSTDIYIDGGIKMNYPLNKCLQDGNIPEEILGINRVDVNPLTDKQLYRTDNLFDYICKIIYNYTLEKHSYPNIMHSIPVAFSASEIITALLKCVSNEAERKNLVEKGMQIANDYILDYTKEREKEEREREEREREEKEEKKEKEEI
jgi:NTE family protein